MKLDLLKPISTTKGWLTLAQNNEHVDYLKIAYLQALSIQLTQTTKNYSVMVTPGQQIPDRYREVFDQVIEIPWGDDAQNQSWKLSNEWKTGHCTPYDRTIKLDADMLFFDDMEFWWQLPKNEDIIPCINVQTYRGEKATSDYYRKVFTSCDLPNLYSGLFYFVKNETTLEFFNLCQAIFRDWESYSNLYLTFDRPEFATTDVVYALAAKLLGIEFSRDFMSFVHMKREIHNVPTLELTENWAQHFTHYFDSNMSLWIENFKQRYPVHYVQKSFCSDELISRYEKELGL